MSDDRHTDSFLQYISGECVSGIKEANRKFYITGDLGRYRGEIEHIVREIKTASDLMLRVLESPASYNYTRRRDESPEIKIVDEPVKTTNQRIFEEARWPGKFEPSANWITSGAATDPERSCSFASAVVGSQRGCKKPDIQKDGDGPTRTCRTCGYSFSILIKTSEIK